MEKNNDEKVLKNHIAALMEHFDTVQVFATKADPDGGTIQCSSGGGNWFARYGQISLWVEDQSLYGDEVDEEDFSMEI